MWQSIAFLVTGLGVDDCTPITPQSLVLTLQTLIQEKERSQRLAQVMYCQLCEISSISFTVVLSQDSVEKVTSLQQKIKELHEKHRLYDLHFECSYSFVSSGMNRSLEDQARMMDQQLIDIHTEVESRRRQIMDLQQV